MASNENSYFGFKRTRGDASRVDSDSRGVPAVLVPALSRDLHFASAADEGADWNVSNPTHPTFYIHSETTPATDYIDLYHDATNGYVNVASGNIALQVDATTVLTVASTGLSLTSGNLTAPDDALLGIGTGNTARFSFDTTDANANELLLQLPAGGAVDVPVLLIGQSIESVDVGLYNGVVDPRIAMFGVGAVATGPGFDFRKARGTIAAPTVVTTGDDLGTIRAYGAVAAGEYVQAAEIRFDMAGTIATTRGPGTITFLTATDAAPSVLTQAMLISAAQVVTLASGITTGDHRFNLTITAGADGVGASGEQLTSGGAGAETNWAAASSKAEFKNLHGWMLPSEALNTVLSTPVHKFHYRTDAPHSTGDFTTEYVGVIAEEAPWAMHYDGGIVNPINTLGYTIASIQALQQEINDLKAQLAQR